MKARFLIISLLVALSAAGTGMAQNLTVTGVVKDAAGEPVISAGVMLQGTTQGTVTDFDGN